MHIFYVCTCVFVLCHVKLSKLLFTFLQNMMLCSMLGTATQIIWQYVIHTIVCWIWFWYIIMTDFWNEYCTMRLLLCIDVHSRSHFCFHQPSVPLGRLNDSQTHKRERERFTRLIGMIVFTMSVIWYEDNSLRYFERESRLNISTGIENRWERFQFLYNTGY